MSERAASPGDHPAAPAPERRLRRDAARSRQRLIAAAREVFATRGLSAGLNEIAHHAGVGVGTAYRHFSDRESLIEAALRDRVEAMASVAEQGLGAPTGWDGLVQVLREAAAMMVADVGLRDVALSNPRCLDVMAEMDTRVGPVIAALLARAQAEGSVRPDVTVPDLHVLLIMVTEFAQRSAAVEPHVYRRYLELFIDGLRPGSARSDLGPPLSQADLQRIVLNSLGS
ncbi:MAG: TetR/AcrR family transcriptional regulator [Thermomicrobiales bacterium]|nr:TetR/AcrR family transcriptional regulator [Thermomicrobiales bacterium]